MKELNLVELDTKTPEEIENLRVTAMKELETHQNHCALVEQDYFDKQLKIIDLSKEKKELEIQLSKSKQIIRQLNTQIKILTSKFWSARGGRGG